MCRLFSPLQPPRRYTEQQKPRVLVSLAAVGLFMAVGWPLIVYYTGWWGLVKFWLMPWLGYHFWMSE
jgi:omega-6 fatty acid desaturase (delta-12 desaturase)